MAGELVPFNPYPVPTGNLPVPAGSLSYPNAIPLPSAMAAIGPGQTASQTATQQMLNQLMSGGGGGAKPPWMTGGSVGPEPAWLQSMGQRPMYGPPIPNGTPVNIRGGGLAGGIPITEQLAAQAAGAGVGAGEAGLIAGARGAIKGLPFPKGAAGRIGLGLGLSYGGNFLGEKLGGNESTLGRFAKGAGSGAALGSIFGPEGALVGGVLGGGYNALFGGKDKGISVEKLSSFMSQSGMPADMQNQLMLMYQLDKELTDEKTAKANLGQRVSQYITTAQSEAISSAAEQRKMLAAQALTGQFFAPFTKNMIDSAQMRFKLSNDNMANLPPEYAAIARQQNIAALDSTTRLANAYAAQAQTIPAMATLQSQQSGVNQIAQQLFQQSMSQAALGGGATDLQSLLATAGAAPATK